ncbi:MAG: hypothetical protein ACTHKA_18590 [Anaerocolumna jejuensis]
MKNILTSMSPNDCCFLYSHHLFDYEGYRLRAAHPILIVLAKGQPDWPFFRLLPSFTGF